MLNLKDLITNKNIDLFEQYLINHSKEYASEKILQKCLNKFAYQLNNDTNNLIDFYSYEELASLNQSFLTNDNLELDNIQKQSSKLIKQIVNNYDEQYLFASNCVNHNDKNYIISLTPYLYGKGLFELIKKLDQYNYDNLVDTNDHRQFNKNEIINFIFEQIQTITPDIINDLPNPNSWYYLTK